MIWLIHAFGVLLLVHGVLNILKGNGFVSFVMFTTAVWIAFALSEWKKEIKK